MPSASATLARVVRDQRARLLGALTRALGDLERAEEALDEAVARALVAWPRDGTPERPEGWLLTVARRIGVDRFRRDTREVLSSSATAEAPDERPAEEAARDEIPDERLRLLFAVLHPALAAPDQVALALRVFGGLESAEIARALVTTEADVTARLRAARAALRGQAYEIPGADAMPERLAGVLASIYLLFNEGYLTTRAEVAVQRALCREALRIAGLLAELLPTEPEVEGLLALMLLHDARADARLDAGALVLLAEQDRRRWDHAQIALGTARLDHALAARRPGPYQVQAAIAALHCAAPDAASTDWAQIAGLYGSLLRYLPTPVVELNAAVALAMAAGPERGLVWLDGLARRGHLVDVHRFHAARGELLARAGRHDEAITALRAASALATSPAERDALTRRIDTIAEALRAPRRRRRLRLLPDERGAVPELTDRQWSALAELFPRERRRGRPPRDPRPLVEAALWVGATGAPWRELPARFGPWQTAFHHHRAWLREGRWEQIIARLGAGLSRWERPAGGAPDWW
jgi:RNA polymerase sigma-70 factor (ECF subfamily)